jgi:protein-S-isoprenylcysteine O-methyltransferase Ste14
VDGLLALTFLAGAARACALGGFGWIAGAFQAAMALAFLLRSPQRRAATPAHVAAALPSLALAGFLARAAADAWDARALAVAGIACAVALLGLGSLGRSFAILPGVRTLRTGGAYAWVRHPIYLGELTMAAAAASRLGPGGAFAFAGLLVLVGWRITAEEAELRAEPGWTTWAARVRWRLLPGVW